MKSRWVFLTAALAAFSVSALASAAPLPAVSMRPGDALGDAPAVSGREALATVHDMNPHVAFVPIDDTGPQRAARLVVESTRTQASRLAWEVRYAFSCIETRANRRGPKIRRNVAYAYVDARSGALVFGRDPLRLGGAVDQDY